MDRILSDRAIKIIVLLIAIILVVDIVNVFALGGPSVFSLIFKSGNASEKSSSAVENSNPVSPVHTAVDSSLNQTTGSSSNSIQAIYVPTKATPIPTVRYVSSVTPIKVATTQSSLRAVQPSAETTEEQDNYVAIYSNDLAYTTDVPSAVAFDVVNPPLVIKYTVYPNMTTDSINHYNHTATHPGADELINVTRPMESAWFTVTIYNKDTGQEVTQTGYGGIYDQFSQKTYTYRTAGNYLIQFDGANSNVHVDMFLKKEGNLA
jgi:hypothetical protein